MAASKLQMHVSPLPDKISTKFQRLFLCFRGLAFHWDIWEDYETKPEVEKFKMATSQLQLRASTLSGKISMEFKRLYLRFRGASFPLGLTRILCDQAGSGYSKIAAGKLQLRVSPLPDKISTKFQRLCLCFRGLAFHWEIWEYYEIKPKGEKFKLAAG